jgi:hypothetical protein
MVAAKLSLLPDWTVCGEAVTDESLALAEAVVTCVLCDTGESARAMGAVNDAAAPVKTTAAINDPHCLLVGRHVPIEILKPMAFLASGQNT